MIVLRAYMELKDTIMVPMPKLIDECLKNLSSDVAKNLKNPRQAVRGVSVGPKVGFKPVKQVYRQVLKNIVNTSGKKKQNVVPKQDVSNSNPFDALNSIENDDDLSTKGENSNSDGKGSLNVVHCSCHTSAQAETRGVTEN
ncbi:hypothetical protein Tco_0012402 [Tanacetum coccineum]